MAENIFKLLDQSHYLTVYEGDGQHKQISPLQVAIYAKSGWGKSLASEFLAYQLWKNNHTVIIIADPKNQEESCYAKFLPRKWYHLEELRKWGIKPEKIPVKIYHPFTFSLDTRKYLPEINFFTLSLKDMTEEEWAMLAESEWTSETVNLLASASRNLSDSDGLYSFVHKVRDMVKGKRKKGKLDYDAKNFYLDSSRGTSKSLAEMSNYLDGFKIDAFLGAENSPIKIDWESVFNDQSHYHVFTSSWIDSPKLKHFLVMTIMNQIVRYAGDKKLAKYPIVFIIPEIGKICPENASGYQFFLSKTIRGHLTTMRSKGRGMGSICDAQIFEAVDERISDASNFILFGELSGSRDLEKLAKARSWNKDTKLKVANLGRKGKYLISGHEDEGGVIIPPPPTMHKEPEYNFFEMYHEHNSIDPKEYPEKRYFDLVNQMKVFIEEDANKIKAKIEKEKQETKLEEERKEREKENSENKNKKEEQKDNKIQKIQSETKERLMKLCYDLKIENPEISFRQMGKKLEINRDTAKKYYELYLKKLEESGVLANPENKETKGNITQ